MSESTKKRVDHLLRDPTVFLIVTTVLVVIVGIVIAEVQGRVGFISLLTSAAIILVVYWISVKLISIPILQQISEAIGTIQTHINPESIAWLLDTDQLAEYETNADADEIWLLSSDLLEDLVGGPFQSIVKNKTASGTKYIYFVPDTPELRARITVIKSSHKHNDRIKVVLLPDKFFFLVPKLDIVIYNPLTQNAQGTKVRTAFMGIPDPVGKNHYHARMNVDFVDRLVGVLLESNKNAEETTVH